MAERTLAEAIAELRLSDRKFSGDIANLRRKLLSAVTQMEADARIAVGFTVNDKGLGDLAASIAAIETTPVVVPVTLDADKALADLVTLTTLADPVVVPVTINADNALGDLVALTTIADPVVVRVVLDAEQALADLAALTTLAEPVVVPVTFTQADTADRTPLLDQSSFEKTVTVTADTAPAKVTIDALASEPVPPKLVTVTADTVPASTMVLGWLDAEGNQRLDVPVNIDAAKAVHEATAAQAAVQAAIDPVVAPLKVDTTQAVDHLPDFEKNVDSIHPMFKVGADLSEATAGLEELAGKARRLHSVQDMFIPPDFGPATAAVDEFGNEVEQNLPEHFGRAGEESGRTLADKLKGAMQGVASTIGIVGGAFIAGALVKGFERLNTIEDATASLTVQLGSATDAAKLLDGVLGVVKGTPFNLDQFAKAAADMVAFGIESNKIPHYLTAIGEASASQGGRANEVAQRLSLIFGQITTASRIGGQELLQFSEAGVNATVILANHFGVTTLAMREMISKGAVPAKEALDVLSEGILHGTTGIAGTTVAFAGTMAKLRETLTGAIGGFSAATARFGVQLIEPFKEAIISAFQGATTVIDHFAGVVKSKLGAIGRSDFVQGIVEQLKNLPDLVDKVTGAFDKFGPAIAPLAGLIGASGLGSIAEKLGPLGKFIPEILTNPIIAATAAFVLFTPEVRDKLVPVVEKLVPIFVKLAGTVGVVGGKLIDSLIPVIVKLVDVADAMVPLVETGATLAEVLTSLLVPAFSVLSHIITAIPVPAIEALVVAFVALKAASKLEGLAKGFSSFTDTVRLKAMYMQDSIKGTTTGLVDGSKKSLTAVNGMAVGVAGAFSGMALSSKNGATQITGAIGAIGALATGFATGGPWGLAIAGAGVAIGGLIGHFKEQADKTHAAKARIDEMTQGFTDQTIELLKDNDALTQWLKLTGDAGVSQLIGAQLLGTDAEGVKNSKVASDLGLASTGKAGEAAFTNQIIQLREVGFAIEKDTFLSGRLTEEFGKQAPQIGRLITKYGSLDAALAAIKDGQERLANNRKQGTLGLSVADLGVDQDIVALDDMLNGKGLELTSGQTVLGNAITSLMDTAKTTDIGDLITGNLNKLKIAQPEIASILKLIEQESGITIDFKTMSDDQLIALYQRVLKVANGTDEKITESAVRYTSIRTALIGQEYQAWVLRGSGMVQVTKEVTAAQVDEWRKLAELVAPNVDFLDSGVIPKELIPFVEEFIKKEKEAAAAGEGITPPLDEAAAAAKVLSDHILLSKYAAEQVNVELQKMHGIINDISSAGSFDKDVRGIGKFLGGIINESDLKKGESLSKSVADTAKQVQQLQADISKEYQDAAVRAVDLRSRIERDKALGSVTGTARLEFELAHVDDAAHAKEAKLAELNGQIADKRAEMAALSQVPVSALDQLWTQWQAAIDQFPTFFDFLVAQPTDEAQAFFSGQLASTFGAAIDEYAKAIAEHPEDAVALGATFRAKLIAGLTDTTNGPALDPATATALTDALFDPAKVAEAAAQAAKDAAIVFADQLKTSLDTDKNLQNLIVAFKAATSGGEKSDLYKQIEDEFHKNAVIVGLDTTELTPQAFNDLLGLTVPVQADVALTTPNTTVTSQTTSVYQGSLPGEIGNPLPPVVKVDTGTLGPSVPLAVKPDKASADKAFADLQFTTNKAKLEKELALVPPDSAAADRLIGEIQDLVTAHNDLLVDLKIKPLTHEEISAALAIDGPTMMNVTLTPIAPVSDLPTLTRLGRPQREGGIIGFDGGTGIESHLADIVSAGTYRIFAEPETHGEGYIPLSPFKRDRSMQIMTTIADMFGYTLTPKDQLDQPIMVNLPPVRETRVPLPSAMLAGASMSAADADLIGRAVARYTKPTADERANEFANRYEQGVHIGEGAIVIQHAGAPARTATAIVSRLADLAIRRR